MPDETYVNGEITDEIQKDSETVTEATSESETAVQPDVQADAETTDLTDAAAETDGHTSKYSSENKGGAYIHLGCDDGEILCGVLEKYGFPFVQYNSKADVTELHNSIGGARIAVIIESDDVIEGNRIMAYQVREALARKREVVIICKRDYTDFSRKFDGEENVLVIKNYTPAEVFHLLFIEKLCKIPELCEGVRRGRDDYGNIIHHATEAWRGVPASEKYIADHYLFGDVLPKLSKQAVFWYTRAREHGSLRAIVALGDCYFAGNGCPQNRKKAYELYCEAAEHNTPEGLYKQGKCKLEGEGTEIDYEGAYKCLSSAVALKKDCFEAEYYLGVCYRDGHGTEKSHQDMKAHFLRSAKGNFLPALVELGDLFSDNSTDEYNPTLAFEYYGRAAAAGSTHALYRKGIMLSSGEGCEKNEAEAFECFKAGAEQKNLSCLCSLGICYEFGVGCEYDYKRAFECYQTASDGAHPAATNNLGGCYYYGHGVKQDRKKALELFERASLFGDANAATRLGLCYESGADCEKDIKKAFSYFSRAAQENNPIAAYKTALCYESGDGVEKDFKRAYEYFLRAARLGHTEAMWHTANYLSDGVGTPSDVWEAYKWYSKGAEAGHADCYLQMAHFSFKGIGTGKNYTRAYYCYGKAYELLSKKGRSKMTADIALRIGVCNLRALGTKENRVAALEWFKKSAAGENTDAIFLCGESYYYGSGCEQNAVTAAQYYTLAAKEGHARALIALARCYEDGFGVEKNIKRAVMLYRKAAEQGNAEAEYSIARIIYENGGSADTSRDALFRASNKGHICAILLLGKFYEDGHGLPENIDKAAEKYLHAIALGMAKQKMLLFSMPERDIEKRERIRKTSVEATYRLGLLKGYHARSAEDYTQAFEYLAGAAATGSHDAQIEIARIYAAGGDLQAYFRADKSTDIPDSKAVGDAMNKLGDAWYEGKPLLSKNDRAALKCYRVAAELGHADAAYSLGWCLRHGVGSKVDDIEAAKWLKKAADMGNMHAMYSYGLCCEEGSGMEHPNLREAASYYRKAAAAGHADAKKRHLKIAGK